MPNKSEIPQWLIDANAGRSRLVNPDGGISTVKTVGFQSPQGYMVAPSIRIIGGQPQSLTPQEAVEMALQRRDAIPFPTQQAGDQYSQALHQRHAQQFANPPILELLKMLGAK